MFVRTLVVLCCLAAPAAGEILVQDGDYYPQLIGHEPIRITGGRIDELIVGGFQTTIEGGSFGRIHDMGDTPFLFRTGKFTLDQRIEFDGVPRAAFEGFYFREISMSRNSIGVGGLYADYSAAWVTLTVDANLCQGADCPFRTSYILHEHLLGDTNGDGVVDLTDLNNVRENFSKSGGDADIDGDVDLDDLNAVRNNFGATLDPVPEPATWALLLVGGVGTLATLRGRGTRRRSYSGN